jgi:iron-sulfur cluster assembly protein
VDSLEVISSNAESKGGLTLQLTEAAANKGLSLLAKSDMGEGALRVAVRDGGCSGMRYELLFDIEEQDDDTRLEVFGVPVWGDAESAVYLDGITIDFSDELNDAGFKIQNPKASETCGCGESFAL